MRARTALLLASLVAAAGLLGAWRYEAAREAEKVAAVEASRIRSWARSHTAAGVSVLPKRVPPADGGELRRLDTLPGYPAYAARCASCHVAPDPKAYAPKQWIGKVAEMREHIERAGVMPPEAGELEAAARFLGAASEALRH